eukprot:scaffold3812_cov55-Attheya_sp.AAC.2
MRSATTAVVSRLASSCHVFLGNLETPAVFGRSIWDNANLLEEKRSPHRCGHYERRLVSLKEVVVEQDGTKRTHVILGPPANSLSSCTNGATMNSELPFGRAIKSATWGSGPCPSSHERMKEMAKKHPYVNMGVVGAVVIHSKNNNKVLLTRRSRHLRTFPGAWVLPGGGLNEDESLAECVAREVYEETSLKISLDSVLPVAAWESCYPTMAEECIEKNGIQAHYLVLYCTCRLLHCDKETNEEQQQTVKLDKGHLFFLQELLRAAGGKDFPHV